MIVLAALMMAQASPVGFAVAARFAPPASQGADGAVELTFTPRAKGLFINESPAPRLKLDPAQKILIDRQPAPTRAPIYDPATARYLDPKTPVRVPVALDPAAPKGTHEIAATAVYFYCSKVEGWCNKASAKVVFSVSVP
ncbi:MAG: hypothetical protein MUF51_01395 [Vicinamibacteria bacterium]|nr:hypothetical protein [Vicinamibacteria bacterium]